MPTTSSVEPPPLSQTATLSGIRSRHESAPLNASSASSSAASTRTFAPAPLASAATSSSPFAARRPGAVTTTSSWWTPSSAAASRVAADAVDGLAKLRVGDPAEALDLVAEAEERPLLQAAARHSDCAARRTSSLTVFEPTSTTPTRIGTIVATPPDVTAASRRCGEALERRSASARRASARARSPLPRRVRRQVPSDSSSQAFALSASSASKTDDSRDRSRSFSTGTTSSSRLSRLRGIRSALPISQQPSPSRSKW